MKTQMPLIISPGENIYLPENEIVSIRNKHFSIKCLSGSLWITRPNGLEQILAAGQSVSGKSNGKVCIVALSDSKLLVKQKHISWSSAFWGWIRKYEKNGHRIRRYGFNPSSDRMWPAVQYPP